VSIIGIYDVRVWGYHTYSREGNGLREEKGNGILNRAKL
jgi:hypothetical protein